jgi:orotidine-5'-phosphate decarboxylase
MMTPKRALQEGADYLVMGRAILNHANPEQAIKLIQEEMARA